VTLGRRAIWIVALALAVLWPGRLLSALDGAPLNGRVEAVLIGVVLPALLWLNPASVHEVASRVMIAALLAVKVIASLAFSQHGLCARFTTTAPLEGVISTIEIDEPLGVLRSWDLRADWRSPQPRCTAIFDRAYASREQFPVWFLNLLAALRPGADIALDVDGYVNVNEPGTLSIQTADDLILAGTVGGTGLSANGSLLEARLQQGSHRLQLHGSARGPRMAFIPTWNGQDAFGAARLTAAPPTAIDAWLATPLSLITTVLVLGLLVTLTAACVRSGRFASPALAWGICAAIGLIAAVGVGAFERLAPLLLVGAAVVPLRPRHRNMRNTFLMVGVPWLAMFVMRTLPHLGAVSLYSLGDDWHMFQAAAYSIVMNGQWIRGGSAVFLFQPLYRWVVGGLHLAFGDPSAGETFWDAGCLLASALAGFAIVKPVSGFRAAVAASALTLATFTLGPIWYLIGRGLSEITGLGWMSLALMCLMRARRGRVRVAAVSGVFTVLMFWTRLNHMLMTAFLLAGLLPARTAAAFGQLLPAVRRVRALPAAAYVAIAVSGVALFAAHTWWYAGHFSVVYGTSFAAQQTGLRPSTIASPVVWRRIAEAFGAQLSMNEPPAFDARAAIVAGGAVLSALALFQVHWFKRLPAMLALLTVGTIAGSFVAHTHDYPGRMSVHVVPFAVAMSVCAAEKLWGNVRSGMA
jgi:hypothetical protein